jgi:hypothetical protein
MPKLMGYYTERHNRIVDIVSEAIRTNCNVVMVAFMKTPGSK